MDTLFATLIFLILVNDILLLAAFRLPNLIRLVAFQGFCLSGLLFCAEHMLLACAVLLIKGLILPGLLLRTRRHLPISAEKPRLHQGLGILAGMAGLILSLWLETRLQILPGLFPPLLLATGLTTLFCGLVLVVGRSTALAQVMGYLVAENGIFVLGIPLMTANTVWFELALLLDIFVAVFVMGIAINHIVETFESIDVDGFRSLRD
ncbi:MAG: hydrogenase-4 component E [Desulfovibrionaceae bacterium]|nr:hydrogenase-4 component E [Desulfovibrionaceae bacterium]